MTKLEIVEEEEEEEKDEYGFNFELVKILKNGIFIIQSKNICNYGAYFFIKFNDFKKKLKF